MDFNTERESIILINELQSSTEEQSGGNGGVNEGGRWRREVGGRVDLCLLEAELGGYVSRLGLSVQVTRG